MTGAAIAETLIIRLDSAAFTSVAASQAAVIGPEGYSVAYAFAPPHHQEFTFSCWGCALAEFVEASIALTGTEAMEIRSRRTLDPAPLIITWPERADPLIRWEVPISARHVPALPPPEDIRARRAAVAALLVRAQEALGVRAFTGAPAPLTLRLREGADLTLEAVGEGADYTYTFQELGRPDMIEIVKVARAEVSWRVEIQAEQLTLQRENRGAEAHVSTILEIGQDGQWEGEVETTTFPGGGRSIRPLERSEAQEFLAESVRELLRIRERLGLTLGRNLTVFRLR
jgi:hypothetical protein